MRRRSTALARTLGHCQLCDTLVDSVSEAAQIPFLDIQLFRESAREQARIHDLMLTYVHRECFELWEHFDLVVEELRHQVFEPTQDFELVENSSLLTAVVDKHSKSGTLLMPTSIYRTEDIESFQQPRLLKLRLRPENLRFVVNALRRRPTFVGANFVLNSPGTGEELCMLECFGEADGSYEYRLIDTSSDVASYRLFVDKSCMEELPGLAA